MGFLKDFFAKKYDTEDEERGGTNIIFPERVIMLILLVKRETAVPSSEEERSELVWKIFSSVNPELFKALPDRAQVGAHLYHSSAMNTEGHVEPDDFLYPFEDLDVPNMASGYIQALRLTTNEITIWLRDKGTPDKEFKIELAEPLVTGDFKLPQKVTLVTIYASNTPTLVSVLWPALPKLPEQPLK